MKIDLKNCTIKFVDGDTPANELEVNIGTGNVTFTERVNRNYELNKGLLDTVRDGDEVPVDVTLGFNWEWLKSLGTEPPTPPEVLKHEGNASSWVSSDADACAPYAVDIVIVHEVVCGVDTYTETITLSDFRHEELGYDIQAGQISCTGKCNITKVTTARVITTT